LKIIAHRGFWNESILPNSYKSFELAFENGYGIETDFRDFDGALVVSHDPPTKNNYVTADDFFKLASLYPTLPLAINIKADGLQELVKKYIDQYNLTNYFVFDMSVPDMYKYITSGIICYTRKSEFEMQPSFYEVTTGFWLDAFVDEWYNKEMIEELLNTNKKVAIVSADLHKRDYAKQWDIILSLKGNNGFQNLFLCTDYPNKAKQFFTL
jgi:glycerophosphoryl diester phosphodiesterase